MKVYRDCIYGIPELDDPAHVTVFRSNGSIFTTLSMQRISYVEIPPDINNPCVTPLTDVCVQEGIYESTVTLPPLTGGYTIVYQRCCRNNSILNLIEPGGVGTTYWEHIPGPEEVAINSSPRFNLFPPIYICRDLRINFDHAATDPDGDVLVYSLCSPFNGLDACCPIILPSLTPQVQNSFCTNPPSSFFCPSDNPPPPYALVPFISPYSGSYPMASSPAININSTTGLLDGVPTLIGQWVVGVCVSEYRNGVLIGTHHRDFQFNVIPCRVDVASAIQTQTQFCTGLTVDFGNQSSSNAASGLSSFWNFGDLSTLADTSHAFSPSYTYPSPGIYTVTLIVNRDQPCTDTSVQSFKVYPLLDINFTAPPSQCLINNSFTFNGSGAMDGSGTQEWFFGPNASPNYSTSLNASSVTFTSAGLHPVKFLVKENGCADSVIRDVKVYEMPTASFVHNLVAGCDPFTYTFQNLSTAETAMSYQWQFSDGGTSTEQNPTHTFSPPGIYSASLTINTSDGCVWRDSTFAISMINVSASPISQFSATPIVTSIFEPDISFTNMASFDVVSWTYDFGDYTSSNDENPNHSYTHWGDFVVSQTVINQYGCPNTNTLTIRILPEFRFWIPNSFTPGNDDGLNDIFKPITIGVEDYTFYIFNRWGEMIYKTNDTEAGWNGTFKGKESPMDVYVWKCDYKNVVTKGHEFRIGHVTLVR